MTDCHAQLLPIHFREPSVNLGVAAMQGQWPHRVGESVLKAAGLRPGSAQAFAYTSIDFEQGVRRLRKVGGFAHLATLVKQLKASRPGALLLDGGDTWQGSATSLWTNAQDMVDAAKLLGVDVMTGHWEFTYGMERVKEIVEKDFKGRIEFIAQNVKTNDFGDPVFKPYLLREINGVPVAIIARPFRTRRSPTRATWSPTGASASRTKACRSGSTRRAPRAPSSSSCCRTTGWMSI